ncbi:hypothetical protein AGR7C_Lc210010 [Agrobacterium deltaense Zutra 3/1]|uniref:Glyoxalase-related protein domain-containing protein n=1 Tax=Agrobacterium deltaense Zutra 3/1 TaxID=1183427 RepID=A0A1S7RQ27_9HYPH|nr:hypothetical protein AGR7C_Lc210010 [Agrobacterium deltaense Zutra 3/1]
MNVSKPLPALEGLKEQAKRLRAALEDQGQAITHSKALELIAAQYGFRDWNTLHASAGNRPAFNPYLLGSRVEGFLPRPAFRGLRSGRAGARRRSRTLPADPASRRSGGCGDFRKLFRLPPARPLQCRHLRPHGGENLQRPAAGGAGVVTSRRRF